jgi:hypothetical protein
MLEWFGPLWQPWRPCSWPGRKYDICNIFRKHLQLLHKIFLLHFFNESIHFLIWYETNSAPSPPSTSQARAFCASISERWAQCASWLNLHIKVRVSSSGQLHSNNLLQLKWLLSISSPRSWSESLGNSLQMSLKQICTQSRGDTEIDKLGLLLWTREALSCTVATSPLGQCPDIALQPLLASIRYAFIDEIVLIFEAA